MNSEATTRSKAVRTRGARRLTTVALLAGAVVALGGTGTAQAAPAAPQPAGQSASFAPPRGECPAGLPLGGALCGVAGHVAEQVADRAADVLGKLKPVHEWD
ncbi:hypothetical protein GCM10010261_56170 [Streptomyces pilosus]|uniref:hypothetical protein n=1 Tax=Streptomyces pilosus TaxID=28893 RepID=UPI001679AC21|nr:hypothetical protein [Streptomyces pilosus]GGV65018.1 hypothetical protein GCM10010261_56170 [Streptomyces pilosus]